MTREEKVTDLIQMYSYFGQFSNEQSKRHCESLQSAITALESQREPLQVSGQVDDLISRQAAIDALHTHFKGGFEEDRWWNSTHVLAAIKEVPSVQPERKTGKWYKPTGMMPPEMHGMYRCSECDELALFDWKHHQQMLSDYCPNCGADMRGDEK